MSTVILACSFLKEYIEAAQKVNQTDYPVIYIDRKNHAQPKTMRQLIMEEEQKMSSDVDAVLVAMGFCGGSLDKVTFTKRTVIPRVDDCITLLLHKTNEYAPNLKEMGHMYMAETDPDEFDMERMLRDMDVTPDMFEDFSEEELFEMLFANYRFLDVVDTGINDCHSEWYIDKARMNADRMNVSLNHVKGSNIILEKLIAGKWDEQFLVAEAGHLIKQSDFF